MNESMQAFIFVAGGSVAGFSGLWLFARDIVNRREYMRWVMVWLGISTCAFLSPDYWLFCAAASVVMLALSGRHMEMKVITALIAFMALPHYLRRDIPGVGPVQYLFELDYSRLVALVLLVPIFIRTALSSRKGTAPLFGIPTDKWVLLFVILSSVLTARGTTGTDALRSTFNNCIDVLVPYFAISRALINLETQRIAMLVLMCTISVLTALTLYELVSSWHLYTPLRNSLNTVLAFTADYKWRGGFLRAGAAHAPIPTGMLIVFALGALAYLRPMFRNKGLATLLAVMMLAGIVSTLSRGPLVGLVALAMCLAFFGQDRIKRITTIILLLTTLTILGNTPNPVQPYLKFLPVIGESDEEANWTVDYRYRLIAASLKVASYNPLFGTPNYLNHAALEELRQGEGIIDITNSYLQVLLPKGFVGLALFLGIFGSSLLGLARAAMRAPPNSEFRALGTSLIAILVAQMVQIGTVPMLDLTEYATFMVIGLCGSYINVGKNQQMAQQQQAGFNQMQHNATTMG